MQGENIAKYIDHTLLKADALPSDIEKLCLEAKQHQFFSVCVNSSYVPLAKKILNNSSVAVAAVIGFPLGAMDTESKAFETKTCIQNGANEIDMVLHVGMLKSGNVSYVQKDIEAVVRAASPHKVKVIFETSLLNEQEKILACELSVAAGAAFVKTSTGFGGGGATIEDVRLMKTHTQGKCEIKASGGVKNLEQARAFIEAGATRLGTSSGVAIITGQLAGGGY